MEYFHGNQIEPICWSNSPFFGLQHGVHFDATSQSAVSVNAFHVAAVEPLPKSHSQTNCAAYQGVTPASFGGGSTWNSGIRSSSAANVEHHQTAVDESVFRLSRLTWDSTDCASETFNYCPRQLTSAAGGDFGASLDSWRHNDVTAAHSPGANSDCRSVTTSIAEYLSPFDEHSWLMDAHRRQSLTGNRSSSLFCRWGSSPDDTTRGGRDRARYVDVVVEGTTSSMHEYFGWSKMASMLENVQPQDTITAGLRHEQQTYHEYGPQPPPDDVSQFRHQHRSSNDVDIYVGDSFAAVGATSAAGVDDGPRFSVPLPVEPLVRRKPKDALVPLIARAILSGADCRMSLADICRYIGNQSSDYRPTPDAAPAAGAAAVGPAVSSWKNNVRHTLSHYEFFVMSGRLPTGRGNYWTVHAVCRQRFADGDFRIKRARHVVQMYEKNRRNVGDGDGTVR